MSKIHNFSAGPAVLPKEAIEESIDALRNFAGTGLSLLEVSHRGKEFVEVMDQACASVRELMGLTDEYAVVYLQGGASTQFLMVAMNEKPTTLRLRRFYFSASLEPLTQTPH